MLNVLTRSSVMTMGEPMMTSSTYLHASTLSARSCRFMMGRCGPRRSCTSSSVCTPTSRKSPRALAAASVLTWPGWNTSNAPSMYTMRAPSAGTRPLENCTSRRDVGRNLDSVVRSRCLAASRPWSSLSLPSLSWPMEKSRASGCASSSLMKGLTRVQVSMRPTMSVVLTPSVRLIMRKRPRRLACAYASVPSGSRQGSSPWMM
mmetsp:Transcript_22950/g.58649  ORF Transcript_22950/g.58649 Transcript_22950/m.58649 type:complete len:204 (+) Transcript_22950:979-1590(+)